MVQYRRYKGCNLRYVVMSSVAETSGREQRAALFFIRLRYAQCVINVRLRLDFSTAPSASLEILRISAYSYTKQLF